MNADDIEALVKSRAEMPEDLGIAECYYFLSLDYIRRIKLPKEEKEYRYKLVRQSYETYRQEEAMYRNTCEMRVKLAGITKEMILHGCPLCKKAAAIFDGRKIETEGD